MSITSAISEEQSINYSGNDYVTLKDYDYSARNFIQPPQLRQTVVPGSLKHFNKNIYNPKYKYDNNDVFNTMYSNVARIVPITKEELKKINKDDFDYSGYK